MVNSMIQSAYDKKGNRKKVENALQNLQTFITAVDKTAPF